jgi:hypothetical protein
MTHEAAAGAVTRESASMAAAETTALPEGRGKENQESGENRTCEDLPHGLHPADY